MVLVTLFFIFSFTGFLPNQEIKLAVRVSDLVGTKIWRKMMNFANKENTKNWVVVSDLFTFNHHIYRKHHIKEARLNQSMGFKSNIEGR